ncbi:hypothetical protein C2E23DRAFT_890823 [Lenzites betulinus]|nr:hypothetical protein C2E23DRAFT_890823 [Lenzites betulinus]
MIPHGLTCSQLVLRQDTERESSESASSQDEQCADDSDSDDSNATRSEEYLLTTDALAGMNIFGYPDQGVFKNPLVDFSHDLQEHLDEANLPNPMDMLAECHALLEIIGSP